MTRELAKCSDFTFGIEDHGLPFLFGSFEYEDGGAQGFGHIVDTAFLMRFLCAVGVDRMDRIRGRSVWVTHNDSKIEKVEPLHKKSGTPFVVSEWSKWYNERMPKDLTPAELRTGIRKG